MILESATKSCVKNQMATNIVYLDIICVIAEIISEFFFRDFIKLLCDKFITFIKVLTVLFPI